MWELGTRKASSRLFPANFSRHFRGRSLYLSIFLHNPWESGLGCIKQRKINGSFLPPFPWRIFLHAFCASLLYSIIRLRSGYRHEEWLQKTATYFMLLYKTRPWKRVLYQVGRVDEKRSPRNCILSKNNRDDKVFTVRRGRSTETQQNNASMNFLYWGCILTYHKRLISRN